ncbi:circularly permutated Ras protein 1-like isoform X2 [Protopterus annectens]|uniref:circularly permutated Ras protein 1-like isoform X2 n=1 Tax=Protopterus annectens TaxID=7888 RepID=UPI001CFB2164|nr:circularly permutated Ras protein 1-like isoform X2 [Protopterus annectens]
MEVNDTSKTPPPVPKRVPQPASTAFYDVAEGSDQYKHNNSLNVTALLTSESSNKYDTLSLDPASINHQDSEESSPLYETLGHTSPVYDAPESSGALYSLNVSQGGQLYSSLNDMNELSQSAAGNSNPRCLTYVNNSSFSTPPPVPPRTQRNPSYVDIVPDLPTDFPGCVVQPPANEAQKPPPLPQRTHLKHMLLKSNVNVALINAGKLADINNGNIYTGTPVSCQNCTAVLSGLNQVEANETSMWTCDFCETVTNMDYRCTTPKLGDDQIYIQNSYKDNTLDPKNSLVVFCVDISGSMSVTSEIPDSGNGTCVYMSRLQAVKAAISQSLHYLQQTDPSKRVALITFNNEVKIYGDGQIYPVTFQDYQLMDEDYLMSQGQQQPAPQCIAESLSVLEVEIFKLQEKGSTALGPAALLSIAMASKMPGSKVIICTDGKANSDLGNLENIEEDEVYQSSKAFYSSLAEYAVNHGVIVSVLTIEGTDCRLAELGQMADRTGGKVNIVDPKALSHAFQSILEDDVIATNVSLKFVLHKDMYFKYEDHRNPVLEKQIGNVIKDTELTFEFGIHESSLQEVSRKAQLPFQIQMNFTLPDGRSVCRILNQQKPITGNGTLVENSISISVLQIHCSQLSARLAMEGRLEEAREEALAQIELIRQILGKTADNNQKAIYEDWVNSMSPIYQHLPSQQQTVTSSDHLYESSEHSNKHIRKHISDEVANVIFHLKNAKKKMFKKAKFSFI